MTRPVWRPHVVRQEEDHVAAAVQLQRMVAQLPAPLPSGPGQGFPTFAELVFHWPSSAGALASSVSDPHSARWACNLFGAYVDVSTYSSPFTIIVYKNGSPVVTCAVPGAGQEFLTNPVPLIPRVDKVTVNATVPGTGNLGVVCRALTG